MKVLNFSALGNWGRSPARSSEALAERTKTELQRGITEAIQALGSRSSPFNFKAMDVDGTVRSIVPRLHGGMTLADGGPAVVGGKPKAEAHKGLLLYSHAGAKVRRDPETYKAQLRAHLEAQGLAVIGWYTGKDGCFPLVTAGPVTDSFGDQRTREAVSEAIVTRYQPNLLAIERTAAEHVRRTFDDLRKFVSTTPEFPFETVTTKNLEARYPGHAISFSNADPLGPLGLNMLFPDVLVFPVHSPEGDEVRARFKERFRRGADEEGLRVLGWVEDRPGRRPSHVILACPSLRERRAEIHETAPADLS